MSSTRLFSTRFLDVPYEMRAEAKKFKCFYIAENKLWSCRVTDDDDIDKTAFIDNYQQVYLKVPYTDKDDVKSKGAKWDASTKTWYTYAGNAELKNYM